MADSIRTVDYFYIQTANRPGAAARALNALKSSGVNLLAFTGFPSGRKAQLDFVPADTRAFLKAARQAGLKLSRRKSGFVIQGKDRVGAIAASLDKLAKAKINVTAVDAVSSGEGRFGALLWVKPKDQRRAARALGT